MRDRPDTTCDGLPPRVLRAFLAGPRRARTIGDLCCAVGTSAGQLRAVVKRCGFGRYEGLLTWLRLETWKWLVSAGVDRTLAEAYLGILDRSNFRRACKRAGLATPWTNKRTDLLLACTDSCSKSSPGTLG
jgi:hypothetical protein